MRHLKIIKSWQAIKSPSRFTMKLSTNRWFVFFLQLFGKAPHELTKLIRSMIHIKVGVRSPISADVYARLHSSTSGYSGFQHRLPDRWTIWSLNGCPKLEESDSDFIGPHAWVLFVFHRVAVEHIWIYQSLRCVVVVVVVAAVAAVVAVVVLVLVLVDIWSVCWMTRKGGDTVENQFQELLTQWR